MSDISDLIPYLDKNSPFPALVRIAPLDHHVGEISIPVLVDFYNKALDLLQDYLTAAVNEDAKVQGLGPVYLTITPVADSFVQIATDDRKYSFARHTEVSYGVRRRGNASRKKGASIIYNPISEAAQPIINILYEQLSNVLPYKDINTK